MEIFKLHGSVYVDNEKANQSISKTDSLAERLGNKFVDVGNKTAQLGKNLTAKVSAPLAALGIVAGKIGMDFEAQMSKVKAVSGASQEDMKKLGDKAKEMGANTKYSAMESAEALEFMGQAGWKTQDMLDGISGIMNLASSSGEELALVSGICTDSLTAFGLSAKDSGHFADILARASADSNTNVAMLGESFQYVAPLAGALSYSAEDTSIALGLMANAGIKGSQAGTALRASLTNLIKPTDAMEASMQKYGISMTNSDGTMKSLGEVMGTLRQKLGGLDEASQAQAASTIFGKEAMSGMLAIINASETDYNKLTDSINNCDGSAQQMAEVMNDNTKGTWDEFTSKLENIAITLSEIILPKFNEFLDVINNWLDKIGNLDKGTQEFIVQIGALAIALPPLLMIGGKLVSGLGTIFGVVGKVSGAVGNMGGIIALLTNPITLVITAIGAFVAVLVGLYKTNDEVREKIDTCWAAIKELFVSALDYIKNVAVAWIGAFKKFWAEWGDTIKAYAKITWDLIGDIIKVALDIITGVFNIFSKAFQGDWKGCWEAVKSMFSNIWNSIKDIFGNLLGNIIDLITSFHTKMYAAGKSIFTSLWDGVKSVWDNISNWVSDKCEWLVDKLTFWDNGTKKMDKSEVKNNASVDGSNANGLDYVPFDNYKANLHKGEMVLTAKEAQQYSQGNGNVEKLLVELNKKLDRLPKNLLSEKRLGVI